jgi:hypothetical protein
VAGTVAETRRPLLRPLARALVVVTLAASTVLIAGPRPSPPAGGGGGPAWPDPGRFTTRIDNPFWPMAPGSRWVYRDTGATGGGRRVEVTVTDRTVRVQGVEARVVLDVVYEHGRPLEVTEDWFAQDLDGNLWQLGEASAGEGWRAGTGGAEPVLVLPARPDPGAVHRQPAAEVQVLSAATTAKVPFGSFRRVLVTQELGSPEVEHEFYARGVGPVLAVTVAGGSGREELVGFSPARSAGTSTGR